MTRKQIDFLDAMEREFDSRQDFVDYLQADADLENRKENLNLVGTVSGHDRSSFIQSLEPSFDIFEESENLLLLWAPSERISYYVTLDDMEFPIFFTAANKTDQIPETVGKYLMEDPLMSRMWVGKREMERLREHMVGEHESLIIPEFTAKRSKHSDVPAKKRPNYDRTIRYWADDGLEVFRHSKSRWGVLPTNIQYEVPNQFKCQVTQKGVFTSIKSGVKELSDLIDMSVTRLRIIKNVIDTAEYEDEVSNGELDDTTFSYSKPWAIKLDERPTRADIEHFEGNLKASDLQFRLLDFKSNKERHSFDAELMDKKNYGRTDMRTKEDSIRIFPNGPSYIDESIRIYNFVNDHIDPNLEAIEVA